MRKYDTILDNIVCSIICYCMVNIHGELMKDKEIFTKAILNNQLIIKIGSVKWNGIVEDISGFPSEFACLKMTA